MEGLAPLLNPDILAIFIPILAVVGVFSVMGVKAYFNHVERMEKIRNGMDPDAASDADIDAED